LRPVAMQGICSSTPSAAVARFAQKLGRQWIGIDRFPLAIALSDKRLTDAFPGMHYDLHGTNGNVTAFST
jgi:hypothetical protein